MSEAQKYPWFSGLRPKVQRAEGEPVISNMSGLQQCKSLRPGSKLYYINNMHSKSLTCALGSSNSLYFVWGVRWQQAGRQRRYAKTRRTSHHMVLHKETCRPKVLKDWKMLLWRLSTLQSMDLKVAMEYNRWGHGCVATAYFERWSEFIAAQPNWESY